MKAHERTVRQKALLSNHTTRRQQTDSCSRFLAVVLQFFTSGTNEGAHERLLKYLMKDPHRGSKVICVDTDRMAQKYNKYHYNFALII